MPLPPVWESLSTVPGEPRTRVKLNTLSESLLRDLPASTGGSGQSRIVMNNRNSVSSYPDIEFDCIRADGHCLSQRLDCVFGSVRAISAVTNDRACFGVEQNVHLQKITGRRP